MCACRKFTNLKKWLSKLFFFTIKNNILNLRVHCACMKFTKLGYFYFKMSDVNDKLKDYLY